jgi:hypothetical protein
MATMSINLRDSRESFVPGEVMAIEGEATWQLDKAPAKVFLRLFWFTRGKGTEDIEVISETVFEHPLAAESRPFKIPLPQSPYSFSGRLVSLIWALELVTSDNDTAITKEITISPFGSEIDLLKHKQDPA